MDKYSYCGPVMKFDSCVDSHWSGETTAASEKKARSNLVYQYKKECGLEARTKITLPGKMARKGGND